MTVNGVTQMKERSITTLGYLPVGDADFPHQKKLLQGLMDSVEVRHWSETSQPMGSEPIHLWVYRQELSWTLIDPPFKLLDVIVEHNIKINLDLTGYFLPLLIMAGEINLKDCI